MFEAEADGLAELRSAGAVRVPEVYDVGTDADGAFIEMERLALGRGVSPAEIAADGRTYEGAATAAPVAAMAARLEIEMPISATVAVLVTGELAVPEAVEKLFNRPLRRE